MNEIPVLYENDEIFVINKPAGLAVQGGEHIAHPLDETFSKQVGYKIYLVHRLDKETNGLMIVAKNPVSAAKWTKLISSKIVRKEYSAICAGVMPKKDGIICESLEQHGQTKSAYTEYHVEENWTVKTENPDYPEIKMCRLRLILETGRMHQIRIHLAKQNCPIAGDDQHGNFKLNKVLKKACGIKTLQLTSRKLTIPVDGKEMVFEL